MQSADQGREPFLPSDQARIADIQLILGQIHLDRNEPERAFEMFAAAARSGIPRAINMLGRAYERGWGVQRNVPQAVTYFEHAAAGGEGWADFNLADLYLSGDGVPRDRLRAFTHYARAAQRGVGKALNMLGILCEQGIEDGKADNSTARSYFLAGAEAGDCWSAFNMGRLCLEDGKEEEALRWFRCASSHGFPEFWCVLEPFLRRIDHPVFQEIAADAARRVAARRASAEA